uniref:Uncharacterized protein n=1 Tax=Percolomonas cosmopolitus TaxID=63605 RepID=A0A7S1KP29_9EUKA|mmetsp:Transcript_3611/g.13796  ORF Transcript_3611/g.13796 Transcript_3611/m.13796 type:complete len:349 (+) Transcript_3611:285-1331(+)|eukprot:CAMPEP_0117444162 /NCGR_PEP_ID=MMETSP0759-20121206/5089_1 /TAXON_ID=63605 /ORGANISM="Percolomonas cosmopolitus, Strain WS" /LENGTH=348 /DNA_ID=CAMNT_0005236201 /DNA_START=267 /DNA_END=1313 /DNA_ORIENTATION=+
MTFTQMPSRRCQRSGQIVTPSFRIDPLYYCDMNHSSHHESRAHPSTNSQLQASSSDFSQFEDSNDESQTHHGGCLNSGALAAMYSWQQESSLLGTHSESVTTPHSQVEESNSVSYKSPTNERKRKMEVDPASTREPARKKRKIGFAADMMDTNIEEFSAKEIARMHQREEEKERTFLLIPSSEVPVLVNQMPSFHSHKRAFVFFLKLRPSSRCGLSVSHLVNLVNCKQCVVDPQESKPQARITVNRATEIIEKDIEKRLSDGRDPVFAFADEEKRFVRYCADRKSRKKTKHPHKSSARSCKLLKGTPKRLHESYFPEAFEYRNYSKMRERFLQWKQQKEDEDVIFDEE